ncbi:hypothetical protein ACEPAF_6006 [Sanghuangporus sanghuang]
MATDSSNTMILPIANVQHDFQSVISDVRDGTVVAEDIWLSCYKTGSQSVHGKVRVGLGERQGEQSGTRTVELVSRDGVHLERGDRGNYIASCETLSIPPTTIRVPRYVVRDSEDKLKDEQSKQINTITVAPDLSQIALGYENGSIRRLPLPFAQGSGEPDGRQAVPLTYTPHLSGTAVEALSYFPSSRVLLSAGADFMLHVLDADPSLSSPPKSVRSFKGHIRPITSVAIIERGRNVLSAARDGTLRLWDVSGGKQIKVMGSQKYSAINALSLGQSMYTSSSPSPNSASNPELDPREVGTADKHVFLALQNGDFECIDLGTKDSVFHSSSIQNYERHGPLTSIAFDSSSSLVATGSSSGVVTAFDTRQLSAPLCAFQRNSASIEGLGFVETRNVGSAEEHLGDPDLAIATSDGLPFVASIRPHGPEVRAELACGGDCEPTRTLTVDSRGAIWLAGDEGVARMY